MLWRTSVSKRLLLNDRATKAELRVVDLQARARRNNLIFINIPEIPHTMRTMRTNVIRFHGTEITAEHSRPLCFNGSTGSDGPGGGSLPMVNPGDQGQS